MPAARTAPGTATPAGCARAAAVTGRTAPATLRERPTPTLPDRAIRAAACCRRRASSTSPPRHAAPVTRPAASSTVFSHCGIPAAAGAPVLPGRGRCPMPAGADGGTGRPAGLGAAGDGAAAPGTVSTVPGRITSGSGPARGRLAAYKTRQPPRTASGGADPGQGTPDTSVGPAGAPPPGS